MSDIDNELDYVRITIRVSRHSDPMLFNEIAPLPPFHRSRRFSTLAVAGLLTEKNQGVIAGVQIQHVAPTITALQQQDATTPSKAKNATSAKAIVVKASQDPEEEVHYPGAGNTNVDFESVFGPME